MYQKQVNQVSPIVFDADTESVMTFLQQMLQKSLIFILETSSEEATALFATTDLICSKNILIILLAK